MNLCWKPKTMKQHVMYYSLILLVTLQIFLPHGALQHAVSYATQVGVLCVAVMMAGRRCSWRR